MLFFDARRRTARRETMNVLLETVAFLDVQVNHITKDVGHINNKVFQKTLKDSVFFAIAKRHGKNFHIFAPNLKP